MDLHDVNLNLLVVLDALLAEKSVGKVAVRLNLSQPAISHSLANLRELFNDDLFIKTASGMELTAFSQSIQTEVKEIIKNVDLLVNKNLDYDPVETQHTFHIGMVEFGETNLLPKLIHWRRKNKSKVLIRTVSLMNQNVDDLLDRGIIDLAITNEYKIPQRLEQQKLQEEKFVCVTWKDHPILKQSKSMEDYLSYPHVLVTEINQNDFSIVNAALGEHKKDRQIVLTVNHYAVLPHVLEGSYLIATITEASAKDFAKHWDLEIWPCPFSIENVSMAQVWHKRNSNDSAHKWLREFFKSVSEN